VTASEQIQAQIVEFARNLKDHPQFGKLTHRESAAAFVFGNMLFVLLHELAHAAIADLDLGREEDAADEFAVLRMLWWGRPSLTACAPTRRRAGFSAPDAIERR
jgi:hypothetical protein